MRHISKGTGQRHARLTQGHNKQSNLRTSDERMVHSKKTTIRLAARDLTTDSIIYDG